MKLLDNVQYIVLIDNSLAGPQDLLQYYFKGINHCAEDGAGRKGLFVDITLGRPKTSNMITIFLPTGMLVLISHLSIAFAEMFLDLVMNVNTTILLVLTT